jgi:thiosulfate dehydrogenase
MMNIEKSISLVLSLAVVLLLVTAPVEGDEGGEVLSYDDYEQVLLGGLLYDNWYSVFEVKPNGTHPSYPAGGKKTGSSTWRCKECHGWDYRGKDGAYAKGSHYTGITGIRDASGESPVVIMNILKNDAHAFGDMMSDSAYEALSYFIAYGQTDMDRHIDRSTKQAKGDVNNGARIYASTCAKCHGADGRKINFKSPENPEYLGTLSNKNPWETLHKIRFGQPKTEMVNLFFLDIEDQVDVLSYCQTLSAK